VSAKPSELQAIFDRIEAGKRLRQADVRSLVSAVQSQQVTIATGDRAVAIGGSADGAVIVTGDRNVVITGANAEAIRALQGKRPRSEKLLIQEVQNEVAARLKQSLHNQVFIHLEIRQNSEQVKHPWDSEIKIGDQPAESLSEATDILQVFDRADVAGKLLILGTPGVGKTTTLLELAKGICERANEDSEFPIPVLVNLSSWKGSSQLISDWLVGELKLKYGVKNEIGRKWVGNGQLLPLLDGLDELDSSLHVPCVHAINQFMNSTYRPSGIVVCSRQDEYSNFKTKLQLNGAVSLQALNTKQIQEYLSSISRQDIWHFIQTNPNLTELVRTPLFLSILVLIYKQISIEELKTINSQKESIKYLLNAYITRMLMRNSINESGNESELKNRIYSQRKI
jgi:predicted NACHT family NTPase